MILLVSKTIFLVYICGSNKLINNLNTIQMKNSKLFSINFKDILHGIIAAVLGSVVAGLSTGLQTGVVDPQIIGLSALSTGLGYIGKQLVSNSDNQIKGEQK